MVSVKDEAADLLNLRQEQEAARGGGGDSSHLHHSCLLLLLTQRRQIGADRPTGQLPALQIVPYSKQKIWTLRVVK